MGDPTRLRQVIDNLLANVRAHTPEGTAASVRVDQHGATAEIVVRDAGPGMSTDDAARVFERFYRVDAARGRTHGGSGLGLSIVAAIVAAHGGTVFATSAPGQGLTVTVRIPVLAEAESQSEVEGEGVGGVGVEPEAESGAGAHAGANGAHVERAAPVADVAHAQDVRAVDLEAKELR
jgi:two-component system OmpR family sensor kinase